ncbi:MAG TPA: RidA family protein [Gammaproteobacteria bacterium]|nr:RidA family protein [Gammaproteobacteria bacterium]
MIILDIKKQLLAVDKILPQPPQTLGNYRPYIVADNMAFISGQLPIKNGCIIYSGKLGSELCIEEGKQAAELCALNILSQIVELEKEYTFKKLIKIEGCINSTSDFTQHANVLDGASDLLSSVLLKQAGHARSIIGCSSLPLNAAIEIIATVEISSFTLLS